MKKTWMAKMLDGDLPLPEIAKTLNASLVDFLPDQGTLSMAYRVDRRFTNPAGTIQGGILASMLDDAMSLALLGTLDTDLSAPSLELKVNFILPAFPGTFTGTGKVISRGRRICVLEGDLWQDSRRVARASATALIRKTAAEQPGCRRHDNRNDLNEEEINGII